MPGTYINTTGLINLADRSEEERRDIARRGGLQSGKERLRKAAEREALYFYFYAFNLCDWIEMEYDTGDVYWLMERLPSKERAKVQTRINRVQRQYRRADALKRKYERKYGDGENIAL